MTVDRDEGYEQGSPNGTFAGERTRFVRKDKTLYIQFGNADLTAKVVNKFLEQALELGEVVNIVLYVSQDTAQDQGVWLERQGYALETNPNPRSSSFVYRGPAKKLRE